MTRIGLVQMNSTNDYQRNLEFAHAQICKASQDGLNLVAFPETFLYVGDEKEDKLKIAQRLDGEIVTTFQEYASCYHISILMGSIYESVQGSSNYLYNTSILIGRQGNIQGVYRKIHLCDIDSPSLKNVESKNIRPGSETVVVDHEIGKIGLSICYDLRFPGLFQSLRAKGAEIIFVPAAFFLQTGTHHWFPLLRARAIENQAYIAAPAQWGWHYGDRYSYGHSVLIDPWGTVISCASEYPGIVSGTIDLDYLIDIRKRMPVMEHRRPEYYL
ncbi:MAG: carbon-nitrogen hydrolase family protein [SAR324 cluster bacterium]|nr:carbon-nitrogen hydrolase family protein [SAR324 cluster bacterium]